MNAEASPKLRGTIVKVPDATPGLLHVNGQQKPFTLEGVWKSPVAPAANMSVNVELDAAGAVTSVAVLDQQALNKERLNQASAIAQEKGKEAAKLAQQGVGALAARMGVVALAAVVIMWIAWFFLPGYKFELGGIEGQSFTFSQYLNLDMSNPESLAGGGSMGFFGMLGIIAIAAPFAAPFIKDPRAKYLNAFPLAFIIIGIIATHMSISKAAGGFGGDISSAISMQFGTYLVIICGLILAAMALKPSANA